MTGFFLGLIVGVGGIYWFVMTGRNHTGSRAFFCRMRRLWNDECRACAHSYSMHVLGACSHDACICSKFE